MPFVLFVVDCKLSRLSGLWVLTQIRLDRPMAWHAPFEGCHVAAIGPRPIGEGYQRPLAGAQACCPLTPRLADEETLGIWAVEIAGSHIGDAPILPDLLDQISEGQEMGSVTGDLPPDAPSVRAPLATNIAESCSWPSDWMRNGCQHRASAARSLRNTLHAG